ncbi:MAG: epimerase [Armatimonadetes bacterium]|nr:epimerase [Armatimonadota bacterium]
MAERHPLERVLITGGTGFIGLHLARAVVALGACPLLAARRATACPLPADLAGRVRCESLDLLDAEAVRRVLDCERPTTVFHLAGTRARGGAEAVVRCTELNVSATVRLIAAATEAGVGRIVSTGSAEEYGNQPGPLHEELSLRPATPYGISRAAATGLAQTLAAAGCPVTVLRPFTVYGPGQPAEMFVADAIRCAVNGEPFRMTLGRQQRDLVYVGDVVRAYLTAAVAPEAVGQVINIGSGEPTRLCDLAEAIWELTETTAPLEIGARPAPSCELYDTWADITLARRLLNWRPEVDLRAGLRATIRSNQLVGNLG